MVCCIWDWLKVKDESLLHDVFYDNIFQQNLIIAEEICLEGDQKEYNSPDNNDIQIVVDPLYKVSFFRATLLLSWHIILWLNVWQFPLDILSMTEESNLSINSFIFDWLCKVREFWRQMQISIFKIIVFSEINFKKNYLKNEERIFFHLSLEI